MTELEKFKNQIRKIFAQRLKQARQEKKISQRVLSDLTSINRADIGLYETERKFASFLNLLRIADALNVSLDWLCGRTDKMSGV